MFTEEQLIEMKARSTMKIKEYQTCVADYIKNIPFEEFATILCMDMDGPTIIEKTTQLLFEHADAGKLALPKYNARHTRTSIIRGIMEHPRMPAETRASVYCL